MAERWEILNSASPTETRSTARLRAPLRVTKKENLFRRSGVGFARDFEDSATPYPAVILCISLILLRRFTSLGEYRPSSQA